MTITVREAGSRGGQLRQALRLEWLTVGWNVVEGVGAAPEGRPGQVNPGSMTAV